MRFLDNLRYGICRDRLIRRRVVVVRTLAFLGAERNLIDASPHWNNPSSQQIRKRLLDKIHGWYDLELKKIDAVLARVSRPSTRFEK
jgi:hypothetical protein